MDSETRVRDLLTAYRAALAAGDQGLRGSPLEHGALQALVTASMADTARWLETRVADGTRLAAPLKEVLPALQHDDWVGKRLDWVQEQAFRQARGLVVSVFTTGALPVGVGAVVTFLVGMFLWSYDVGTSVGAALIPTLLAATGAAWIVFFRVAQASPQVVKAVGGAAGSLLREASEVGAAAQQLFVETVGPALTAVREQPQPPVPPAAGLLRGVARGIVLTVYWLFGIGVAVFGIGVVNGVSDWVDTNTCQVTPSLPECQPRPTFP